MARKSPNLRKESDIQMCEVQHIPNRMKLKNSTMRHIIKTPTVKDKKRILKAARKNDPSYARPPL